MNHINSINCSKY